MRHPINECPLTKAMLGNLPVLVSDLRIDPTTLPAGLEYYELRHTSENWDEICELGRNVLVNCYGSLLSHCAIQLNPDGFISIGGDQGYDLGLTTEHVLDVQEYLTEHPPENRGVFTLRSMDPMDRGLLFEGADLKPIGEMYGTIGTEEQVHTVAMRRPRGIDPEEWAIVRRNYFDLRYWLEQVSADPSMGVHGFHQFADPTGFARFKAARLVTPRYYGYDIRQKNYRHALILNGNNLSWHIWTYRN